jgi:hypothetical protein
MSLKIWLRHADPSERLDPKLREAVELGLHRILPFRRDRFGDDTLAIDAIETVVCAASKTPGSIRNPRSYIISSALRRLKRFLRYSPVIRYSRLIISRRSPRRTRTTSSTRDYFPNRFERLSAIRNTRSS